MWYFISSGKKSRFGSESNKYFKVILFNVLGSPTSLAVAFTSFLIFPSKSVELSMTINLGCPTHAALVEASKSLASAGLSVLTPKQEIKHV